MNMAHDGQIYDAGGLWDVAFADRETPRCPIRDRDRVYGNEVRSLKSLNIDEVLTAPQVPGRMNTPSD
jgi:hypothetical protein